MTTTISAGATTITPNLVLGYVTESESANTIHAVLGSTAPAVTLAAESLRQGALSLFFEIEAEAWTAYEFLKTLNIFTLESDDVAPIEMEFVRSGVMTMELDPATLTVWVIKAGYQEVST